MINAEEYLKHIKCLNEWTKAYDEGHPMVSDKKWDNLYFESETLKILDNN